MSGDNGRWRRFYPNWFYTQEFLGLNDSERCVYFYVCTGPQSTSVGIFRVSTAVACEDLGNLTPVEFDLRLSVVIEAFGWKFDAGTRTLWIPSWVGDNPPASSNVVKSWRKLLANVPDSGVKAEALEALLSYLKRLGPSFVEPLRDLPRGFQNPKPKASSFPSSFPKSESKPNQGSREQGTQRSGKQRAGALRAGAMNEGDSPMLRVARRTVALYGHSMGIDQLVDHFHQEKQQENGHKTDDWRRADIIVELTTAIADQRAGETVTQ